MELSSSCSERETKPGSIDGVFMLTLGDLRTGCVDCAVPTVGEGKATGDETEDTDDERLRER